MLALRELGDDGRGGPVRHQLFPLWAISYPHIVRCFCLLEAFRIPSDSHAPDYLQTLVKAYSPGPMPSAPGARPCKESSRRQQPCGRCPNTLADLPLAHCMGSTKTPTPDFMQFATGLPCRGTAERHRRANLLGHDCSLPCAVAASRHASTATQSSLLILPVSSFYPPALTQTPRVSSFLGVVMFLSKSSELVSDFPACPISSQCLPLFFSFLFFFLFGYLVIFIPGVTSPCAMHSPLHT